MADDERTNESKPTAVVADDALVVRTIISDILTDLGISVVATAATGEEAIDLCRLHRPALLTLDISMPGVNGLDALRVISHEETCGTIVVITVLKGTTMVEKVRSVGGWIVLAKPLKREELAATLEELRLVAH